MLPPSRPPQNPHHQSEGIPRHHFLTNWAAAPQSFTLVAGSTQVLNGTFT